MTSYVSLKGKGPASRGFSRPLLAMSPYAMGLASTHIHALAKQHTITRPDDLPFRLEVTNGSISPNTSMINFPDGRVIILYSDATCLIGERIGDLVKVQPWIFNVAKIARLLNEDISIPIEAVATGPLERPELVISRTRKGPDWTSLTDLACTQVPGIDHALKENILNGLYAEVTDWLEHLQELNNQTSVEEDIWPPALCKLKLTPDEDHRHQIKDHLERFGHLIKIASGTGGAGRYTLSAVYTPQHASARSLRITYSSVFPRGDSKVQQEGQDISDGRKVQILQDIALMKIFLSESMSDFVEVEKPPHRRTSTYSDKSSSRLTGKFTMDGLSSHQHLEIYGQLEKIKQNPLWIKARKQAQKQADAAG